MLHIFDQKEPDPQPDRKQTMDRLQNVLGGERRTATLEAPAPPAAVESRPAGREPALAQAWELKQAQKRSEAARLEPSAPTPAPVAPERKPAAVAPELPQFAEQFLRSFLSGVADAVKDINALVSEDRRKVETLANTQEELSARIGRIEESLRALNGASALPGQVQKLDRRLGVQADAIRNLHDAVHAREERLERVLTAFEGLHALSGDPASSRRLPIPDEL